MADLYGSRRVGQSLFQTLASVALVVACLFWAQKVLIPVALALLLTFILAPLVTRLQRLGLGRTVAVLVVVIAAFSVIVGLCWGLAAQLRSLLEEIPKRQTAMAPPDADPDEVARQIVRVVGLPKGQRPFRVHVDPMHDGGEEVFDLGDRIRTEFFNWIGFSDLLHPAGAVQSGT